MAQLPLNRKMPTSRHALNTLRSAASASALVRHFVRLQGRTRGRRGFFRDSQGPRVLSRGRKRQLGKGVGGDRTGHVQQTRFRRRHWALQILLASCAEAAHKRAKEAGFQVQVLQAPATIHNPYAKFWWSLAQPRVNCARLRPGVLQILQSLASLCMMQALGGYPGGGAAGVTCGARSTSSGRRRRCDTGFLQRL